MVLQDSFAAVWAFFVVFGKWGVVFRSKNAEKVVFHVNVPLE